LPSIFDESIFYCVVINVFSWHKTMIWGNLLFLQAFIV
jgi:hypothetical protein